MSWSEPSKNSREIWEILQYWSFFKIDFRFDPIRDYVEKVPSLITEIELKVDRKIKLWEQNHGHNPEMPDWFEVYESELINTYEFKPIFYSSTFLTIYSQFEFSLNEICIEAASNQDSPLKPSDLAGRNYIDKCRRFVEKVLIVKLSPKNSDWKKLTKYQNLRNAFAHSQGVLKSNVLEDQSFKTFLRGSKGVSIEEKTLKVNIESEAFLKEFLATATGYLCFVVGEIIKQKSTNEPK